MEEEMGLFIRLKKDIKERRDDITFLVGISFLISFFIANFWVWFF